MDIIITMLDPLVNVMNIDLPILNKNTPSVATGYQTPEQVWDWRLHIKAMYIAYLSNGKPSFLTLLNNCAVYDPAKFSLPPEILKRCS